MGAVYATIADVELFRVLSDRERTQAEVLLTSASALLRRECGDYGYDLDRLIEDSEDIGTIAKDITVKAVLRAISIYSEDGAAVSQESQAGLGYSASWSYVNAGQALYFLRNELDELGVLRQRYGALEVYGDGTQ